MKFWQKVLLSGLRYHYKQHYVAHNFRYPENTLGGRVCSEMKAKQNAFLELAAVDLLDIKPNDKVLQIDFHSSAGMREACSRASGEEGMIYGTNPSEFMIRKVSQQCVMEVYDELRLLIMQNPASRLPFPSNFIDGVFHCNSFFFWPHLLLANGEIFRVLKPGAQLVCTICLEHIADIQQTGLLYEDIFLHIDPLDYLLTLEAVGMRDVRVEYKKHGTSCPTEYQAIFARKPTLAEQAEDLKERWPKEELGAVEDQEEVILSMALGDKSEEEKLAMAVNLRVNMPGESKISLKERPKEWQEQVEKPPKPTYGVWDKW